MDGAVPSLDDEHRSYRRHPSENEAIEFEVDPEVGDAAADLGSQFLKGATRGEDFGSRVFALDDDSDAPLDLLLDEDDAGDDAGDDESTGEAPLSARPVGRRRAG